MLLLGVSPVLQAQTNRSRRAVLIVGGKGQIEAYHGRNRYILVSGSNNRVEILDTASTVRVTGSNNQVTLHKVRQIEVTGQNNRVSYTKAVTGFTPRIYRRPGNQVQKAR